MKRKLLIVLLSTILCTSCDYEPLFFKTNKKATLDELNSFMNNISAVGTFVPDGWYKYNYVAVINDKEVTDNYTFKIKNRAPRDLNDSYYEITDLIGVSNQSNGDTYRYYCNEDIFILEYESSNGEVRRIGSATKRMNLRIPYILGYDRAFLKNCFNSFEWYIHYNSICLQTPKEEGSIIDDKLTFGVSYNHDFSKILNARVYFKIFRSDVYRNENTIKYNICNWYISSCEPIDITFDTSYEIEYPSIYDIPRYY